MQANQPNNQAAQPNAGPVSITAATFASKFRSKREIWNFLTIDVQAYLPTYEHTTIYFLKDLIGGRKKYIKSNLAKHLHIPQYEGLTTDDILANASLMPNVMERLPERKEIPKLPKQWLINVIYTIAGETFATWVKQRVTARNEKLTAEKNLNIKVDPEIAQAFADSTAVSLTKGISAHLLKVGSKRRRTKEEMKENEEEGIIRGQIDEVQQAEMDDLRAQLVEAERRANENAGAHNVMQDMLNRGDVEFDGDGNIKISKRKPGRPKSPLAKQQ